MAAVTKAKSDANKGDANRLRRNGKAWKKRPCGSRHAADDACRSCKDRRLAA
jgi:hypothetical protein